eukprot:TRINITY_DN9748_c0_g1_i9.p1 TRINITY_DN9748_c0_g1~~TRINITY_DN9748_c0_g1_i9.p1  ORF type:complete len:113 (-),score=17.55 TRINITY_DN9748_c0_g1_i9:39-377(-)
MATAVPAVGSAGGSSILRLRRQKTFVCAAEQEPPGDTKTPAAEDKKKGSKYAFEEEAEDVAVMSPMATAASRTLATSAPRRSCGFQKRDPLAYQIASSCVQYSGVLVMTPSA